MYLLADIGGTNTRIAYSEDLSSFSTPEVFPTPPRYEDFLQRVADSKQMMPSVPIKAAALGITGTFNHMRTELLVARHAEQWVGKHLKDDLQALLNTHVFLENDTAFVGLGEAAFGAGKEYDVVAYITISTGVGGVKIENKKIDTASLGFEPGHQIIDQENGATFTLEQLVSGSGIEARMQIHPKDIHDKTFWDGLHKHLAIGLHNTILHWSPAVVVLGGGLINHNKILIDTLQKYLRNISYFPELPPLKKAMLGNFGGLYGGMHFLKSIQ